MFLDENTSKSILKAYGIKVPAGMVVYNRNAAEQAAAELNSPVALKALIPSGGRGKKGGIKFAATPRQAAQESEHLLGRELLGRKVEAVLVEEKLAVRQELYLGVTIDYAESRPVIIFCPEGGVDIEKVGSAINKYYLNPDQPVKLSQLADFTEQIAAPEPYAPKVAEIIERLTAIFFDYDALTVEINPLVITGKKEIIAADAKIVIDDAALFRHENLKQQQIDHSLHPLEREAEEAGLSLVLLNGEGDVGIICGGAGLGMATMDIIAYYGGNTANFLDTGGGISTDKMAKALEIVLQVPQINGVLINVFGGINNCFNVARGIAKVIDDPQKELPAIPIVVKMQGHFQEEGWALLEQYPGLTVIKEGCLDDAVKFLLASI